MIHWYYIMAFACLLAVFLVVKAFTGQIKARLSGRVVASVLAVGSLLFMAYPYAEQNTGAANALVILTNGFVKDSVDKFMAQHRGAAVFSADPAQVYPAKQVKPTGDISAFTIRHAADTFHVFGNGFSNSSLSLLHDHPFVFHGTPAVSAISHVYWKQQLEPGEPIRLQGTYENNGSRTIKLLLQAFGEDKDSVLINAGSKQDFSLHSIPVHTGRVVYSLLTMDGNQLLQKEPVPVAVQAAAPLQLLIISSSPDFDNTYLKNNLSRKGYQVTVTSNTSTNKKDKQFLNMPVQAGAERLTTSYLEKFDVLMADPEALQKITPPELAAVRSVIQNNGTGLLLKMDGENKQAFYSNFFPVKTGEKGKSTVLQLKQTAADSNTYTIKITGPLMLGAASGTQAILQDGQANVYAAALVYGTGKIIATTLQNTYSMGLAGDRTGYQQLWWLLLNKAAKKAFPEETCYYQPAIPFVDEPIQVQLEKANLSTPVASLDATSIYLAADSLLPFVWKGTYWPVKAGWQPLPKLQSAADSWYVYRKGDWQQLLDYNRAAATKKYAALHPVLFTETNQTGSSIPANIRLWLLFVFLGACIFLWLEQKTG